jgi:hypothetical protein
MAQFIATDDHDAERNFGLGFDDTVSPPWLMVPLDSVAFFRLQGGADLTLQNSRSSEALILFKEEPTVNPSLRSFIIQGLRPGKGMLEAIDGKGRLRARLQYQVKKRRTVKVAFFSVRDAAGNNSKRPLAEAARMIATANNNYLPQANITFELLLSRVLPVPKKLPDVIPLCRPLRQTQSHPSPGPHPLLRPEAHQLRPEPRHPVGVAGVAGHL